jgi:hypothetical protein
MKTPVPTFIHLGLPKTATTCIQKHLFEHHSQIHYFGKFEPGGFPSVIHPVLLSIFHGVTKFESGDIHIASIKEQLAYSTKHKLTPVLSKEGLAGGTPRKTREQACLFKKAFGKCHAILFVREPTAFIKSYYAQMLQGFHKRKERARPDWMKSLGTPPHYFDINKWMASAWPSKNSPAHFLSYADTAETYAEVFGRENVTLFIFEEFVKNPEALITRLCRIMRIDEEEGFRLIDGKRANDRITTGYIRRLQEIEQSESLAEQFRQASAKMRREMLDPAAQSGEKFKPELSAKWLKKINAVGDKQNRRLVKEWGLPLADYGYRL